MLGRLGFAGRIVAIVLLALLAVIALGAGVGYIAKKRQTPSEPQLLVPERAAAIVELIETSPKSSHATLLAAMSSETFKVAVIDKAPVTEGEARRLPAVEWFIGQYFAEVGEREVVAQIVPDPGPRWMRLGFGEFFLPSRSPLEIAIGLEGGSYALFQITGDISPRLFGLPPGFVIGVLGALVGIAALLAIWREARPLRALARQVAEFSGSEPVAPVSPRGAPEIRRLIRAVNDMQARIVALVKGRTVLLGAISHDLKTYITRLRLRAEMIGDEDRRQRTVRDLDDMAALIDDALAVARGAAVSDRRERVDVAALIGAEAAERGESLVELIAAPSEAECVVVGDPVALRRLVTNLLDNALSYGTRARVTVGRQGDRVEIAVEDDGPGIPEAERGAVFEPFYRLEASRSRATGGSGLGLAIARQIVEAHGGTISVDSAPLGGARLAITLPAG